MIRDLSVTLQAILTQPGLPPELAAARIVFERPVEQFNPQQTAIDLFLYDIRENVELRDNEPSIERRNGQAIIIPPPLRVACTYLITAWPVGGTELALQEQRLLGQVLQVLSRYPTIPEPFLQGSLQGQKPSLPMMITAADSLKHPAEFWTSLGTPLRASIAVTITIAMVTSEPQTSPLALTHELRFNGASTFQIGGQVTDTNNQPVVNATVVLAENNLTVTTDSEGKFVFSSLSSGSYTLRVQRPGTTAQTFPITVPALANGNYSVRLT